MSTLTSISWPLLFYSGLVAYIITSWIAVLLRAVGATRYAPRSYWATRAFGSTGGGALFGGRVLRAAALTIFIPVPYAIAFELLGNAEFKSGALLGLAHGIIVGLALPIVVNADRARTAQPGLFGWRLGYATPLLILLIYAIYGAVLGYVYVIPSP